MSAPEVVVVLVGELPKPKPKPSKLDQVLSVASAIVALAMIVMPRPRRLL